MSNHILSEFDTKGQKCVKFGGKTFQLFASGSHNKRTHLWHVKEKKGSLFTLIERTRKVYSIDCLSFSRTENELFCGTSSGLVHMWSLKKKDIQTTFKIQSGVGMNCLNINPVSSYFSTGSEDKKIRVWDVRQAKKCIQTYKGHSSIPAALKFTPDGRWLVSGDCSGTVKVWDLTAGKMLFQCTDHVDEVVSIDYHPSDFLCCVTSRDLLSIWDLQTFKKASYLKRHDTKKVEVRKAQFDRSGKIVLVCTDTGMEVVRWGGAEASSHHQGSGRRGKTGREIRAEIHDVVGIKWGGTVVADFAVLEKNERMLALSFDKNRIRTWLIDLDGVVKDWEGVTFEELLEDSTSVEKKRRFVKERVAMLRKKRRADKERKEQEEKWKKQAEENRKRMKQLERIGLGNNSINRVSRKKVQGVKEISSISSSKKSRQDVVKKKCAPRTSTSTKRKKMLKKKEEVEIKPKEMERIDVRGGKTKRARHRILENHMKYKKIAKRQKKKMAEADKKKEEDDVEQLERIGLRGGKRGKIQQKETQMKFKKIAMQELLQKKADNDRNKAEEEKKQLERIGLGGGNNVRNRKLIQQRENQMRFKMKAMEELLKKKAKEDFEKEEKAKKQLERIGLGSGNNVRNRKKMHQQELLKKKAEQEKLQKEREEKRRIYEEKRKLREEKRLVVEKKRLRQRMEVECRLLEEKLIMKKELERERRLFEEERKKFERERKIMAEDLASSKKALIHTGDSDKKAKRTEDAIAVSINLIQSRNEEEVNGETESHVEINSSKKWSIEPNANTHEMELPSNISETNERIPMHNEHRFIPCQRGDEPVGLSMSSFLPEEISETVFTDQDVINKLLYKHHSTYVLLSKRHKFYDEVRDMYFSGEDNCKIKALRKVKSANDSFSSALIIDRIFQNDRQSISLDIFRSFLPIQLKILSGEPIVEQTVLSTTKIIKKLVHLFSDIIKNNLLCVDTQMEPSRVDRVTKCIAIKEYLLQVGVLLKGIWEKEFDFRNDCVEEMKDLSVLIESFAMK